jgi:cation:H+ antiporter
MELLRDMSPWANALMLAGAAVVLWFCGSHLAVHAKVIAERTRTGQAFIGIVLLGAVVSLPETAMACAAVVMDAPELAVTTLLGGIVFTMMALAITDAAVGRKAVTLQIERPVVPLQGIVLVLLLTLVVIAGTVGDVSVLGLGAWSLALGALSVFAIGWLRHVENYGKWEVADQVPDEGEPEASRRVERTESRPTARVALSATAMAAGTLAAGIVAAFSSEALAAQTGLGRSFVGFVLGGVITTLPELSTTLEAVRLRKHEMAFSDVFGTNLMSLLVLVLCDAIYAGPPLLGALDRFSMVAVLLGCVVTAVYVASLLARPRKAVGRMGLDSLIVVGLGAGGLVLLYTLR